jgi:hypothetical protein
MFQVDGQILHDWLLYCLNHNIVLATSETKDIEEDEQGA